MKAGRKSGRRAIEQKAREVAAEFGAEVLGVELTAGSHLRIRFRLGACTRFVITAPSSEYHAIHNSVAGMRRTLREMRDGRAAALMPHQREEIGVLMKSEAVFLPGRQLGKSLEKVK